MIRSCNWERVDRGEPGKVFVLYPPLPASSVQLHRTSVWSLSAQLEASRDMGEIIGRVMNKVPAPRSLDFGVGHWEVSIPPALDTTLLFVVSEWQGGLSTLPILSCYCFSKTSAWGVAWDQKEKLYVCPLHVSANSCSTTAIKVRLMDLMPDASRDSLLENPSCSHGSFTCRAVTQDQVSHMQWRKKCRRCHYPLKCKSYQFNNFLLSVAQHINLLVQISSFSHLLSHHIPTSVVCWPSGEFWLKGHLTHR